jgi:hypothetical protein
MTCNAIANIAQVSGSTAQHGIAERREAARERRGGVIERVLRTKASFDTRFDFGSE